MADFNTHVTFSSVLGCGYAAAGMMAGVETPTALVAGGLCGVSGMLPDVDSDSGVPRREAMGFAAAIVPMLLLDRFEQMHWGHDQIILAAAVLYFFIRFAAARLIGKWSVHRGMWHSIPAVLIFAGMAFLITGSPEFHVKLFKAMAVGLGALSHLVLDEIYSVDTRGVVPKFKKSFGTAVKLWGKKGWANFSTYAKLAVVVGLIAVDSSVTARISETNPGLADRLQGYGERLGLQNEGRQTEGPQTVGRPPEQAAGAPQFGPAQLGPPLATPPAAYQQPAQGWAQAPQQPATHWQHQPPQAFPQQAYPPQHPAHAPPAYPYQQQPSYQPPAYQPQSYHPAQAQQPTARQGPPSIGRW